MRRPSPSTIVSVVTIAAVLAGSFLAFANSGPTNVLDVVLPLVACAGLLARERYPVVALVVVTVSVAAYYPYAGLDGPLVVMLFVVLYTAADRGHLTAAIATGAAALLAMGVGETGGIRHVDDSTFIMITGWVVASIAFGGVTRNRRAYLSEARQHALDALLTKEEEARRRASEERLRIARELHDVLGHNISMINVQASAALHGIRKRPEDAEAALRTIKETSKETLRELRTTLGVLRQVDEDAPVAPADSLARLDALVAASGLTVRTELPEPLGALPTEVDLAATRIVREALTNVSRHSGTREATLTITTEAGDIIITVDDDGPGATYDGGSGFGIQGMRERATALGGTLEAGPRPGGGFRVTARLPLTQPTNGAR
ncbi:sensor histidine kinase [Nonomuraea gerenzanensis]|uniref:Oxygen sensor histidine kinase NreB n=1 Tax=Nonomuraea gerenzanensis TaxID=93944 RepID=A0A1M4ER01_9ACTN|nr:sensor histidine kinase [Nonomuraea gerenzanensis]UBU12726.1 sensor histidine kinase [Nonomuraea gerenzanensis]SBP01281.1 putative two-component system sensor kinase [Nonomuraea gerenzanensis]